MKGVFKIGKKDHEIAMNFMHTFHPGHEFYGIPLKVRQWIKDNPRSTPLAQWEDMFAALRRGQIPGVDEKYLSPAHIHYWWRKAYREINYTSEDPWVNVEKLLKDHPLVYFAFEYF